MFPSYEMWGLAVRLKFTDLPEERTASLFREKGESEKINSK
jgi:hypothetical protein